MTTRIYSVPGISCDHCKHAIETEITKLTTMTHVEVDIALQTTTEALSQVTRLLALVSAPPLETTTVKHVDLATMQELAVDLDSEPTPAPKSAPAAPAKTAVASAAAPAPAAAPVHHHHDQVAPAAPVAVAATPAPRAAARSKPKQLALATPDFNTDAAPAPSGGNGMLMVSAKPPCDILIDGKSTGLATPQRAIPLSPGAHAITLVNSQNGIKKTIAVKVEAKKSTKLIKDFTRS